MELTRKTTLCKHSEWTEYLADGKKYMTSIRTNRYVEIYGYFTDMERQILLNDKTEEEVRGFIESHLEAALYAHKYFESKPADPKPIRRNKIKPVSIASLYYLG